MTTVGMLESRLNAHEAACNSEMENLRTQLDNKVSYQLFYWVIGILITILLAVMGYVVQQNKDIAATTVATQIDVSALKGKLDPYEIQFQK